MLEHDGPCRAGVLAITAEDTAQHVDLVGAGIALTRRVAGLIRVFRGFHEDGIRRTGRRAQCAADALFEAIVVALKFMPALEARPHGPFDLWILVGHRRLEHALERRP